MMAGDEKKTKIESASKKEPAPKKEAAAKIESTSAAEPGKSEGTKAEGGETAGAAPTGYSRGEGQKPVTQAYKDNWNAIFGKKKRKG